VKNPEASASTQPPNALWTFISQLCFVWNTHDTAFLCLILRLVITIFHLEPCNGRSSSFLWGGLRSKLPCTSTKPCGLEAHCHFNGVVSISSILFLFKGIPKVPSTQNTTAGDLWCNKTLSVVLHFNSLKKVFSPDSNNNNNRDYFLSTECLVSAPHYFLVHNSAAHKTQEFQNSVHGGNGFISQNLVFI